MKSVMHWILASVVYPKRVGWMPRLVDHANHVVRAERYLVKVELATEWARTWNAKSRRDSLHQQLQPVTGQFIKYGVQGGAVTRTGVRICDAVVSTGNMHSPEAETKHEFPVTEKTDERLGSVVA
ncbi:hypothetical protein PF011_g16013 [Phytophthora fragariae]|uniref:Uncharacterized protein n=1 Tax=Phytophthora fragariae TaxID=53985 RepID=A0A6A3JQI1_9STRA|nr:hypothetical protein PF011_g16013 [Phytophthora fragariae]